VSEARTLGVEVGTGAGLEVLPPAPLDPFSRTD